MIIIGYTLASATVSFSISYIYGVWFTVYVLDSVMRLLDEPRLWTLNLRLCHNDFDHVGKFEKLSHFFGEDVGKNEKIERIKVKSIKQFSQKVCKLML